MITILESLNVSSYSRVQNLSDSYCVKQLPRFPDSRDRCCHYCPRGESVAGNKPGTKLPRPVTIAMLSLIETHVAQL